MNVQRGLTLVELMVTLAVLGILLAIGVPSFAKLIASNRIATQTNEFVGGLNLARSEAVRRSQGIALRSSADSLEFGTGWKVFTDSNVNGDVPSTVSPDDGTVIRELSTAGAATVRRVTRSGSAGSYTYADATTSMADRMYVVFNSRGGNNSGSAAFFRLCATGDSTVKGRIVQVSPVGRISLDSSAEAC